MVRTLEAIYENGVLKPLQPLVELGENARVRITVEMSDTARHPLADCIGSLPDEDASEMLEIIRQEFEQVNPSDWQ